jgi:hypothetical protein
MSKERGCVNIVQDGADDLQHGTGVEGNSLPCIKDHYPSKGFLYFTVGKASASDISVLFHEHYITNISEKYSPLYVLMSFQKYFGFFRTSTFRDI